MHLTFVVAVMLILSARASAWTDTDYILSPKWRSLDTDGYQCRLPCSLKHGYYSDGTYYYYFSCELPGAKVKYCNQRENHGVHGWPCLEETPCAFYNNTKLNPDQPSCITVEKEEDQCALKDPQEGPIMTGAKYGYCTSPCKFFSNDKSQQCQSTHPDGWDYCSADSGRSVHGDRCLGECGFLEFGGPTMTCQFVVRLRSNCGFVGNVFDVTDERLAYPPPMEDRKPLPA